MYFRGEGHLVEALTNGGVAWGTKLGWVHHLKNLWFMGMELWCRRLSTVDLLHYCLEERSGTDSKPGNLSPPMECGDIKCVSLNKH